MAGDNTMHCPGIYTHFLIDECSLVHIMDINPMSQLQTAAELGPDLAGGTKSLSTRHIEEKRQVLKSVCSFNCFGFLEALKQCSESFLKLT